MARLIDRLSYEKMTPPGWTHDPQDEDWNSMQLRQAERCREGLVKAAREGLVVVADNVAEYFYAGNEQEEWDLKGDFPTLAPPFPLMVVEYRRPSKVVSREEGIRSTSDSPRCTILLCETHNATEVPLDYLAAYASGGDVLLTELRQQCRWWIDLLYVAEMGSRGVIGPLAHFKLAIDAQGALLGRQIAAYPIWKSEAHQPAWFSEWIFTPLFPWAMLMSFMHCKNVALKERGPDEKLSRAHERRHKKPLCRYHVLEIEPMRQVLKLEGGSEKTGLKRALHVCRGHFADYREGQGLFGKYHGRYWVPMHARGSIKEGVVAKDYAVKAPRKSAKVLTVDE